MCTYIHAPDFSQNPPEQSLGIVSGANTLLRSVTTERRHMAQFCAFQGVRDVYMNVAVLKVHRNSSWEFFIRIAENVWFAPYSGNIAGR